MAVGKPNSGIVQYTAKQLASSLLRQIALAHGDTKAQVEQYQGNLSHMIHFHDTSGTEIAWNDVQVITMFNAIMGENLPVPMQATEGYNQHGHSSSFDGGFIGVQAHSHADGSPGNGGFAFAIYHPGSAVGAMPWSI